MDNRNQYGAEAKPRSYRRNKRKYGILNGPMFVKGKFDYTFLAIVLMIMIYGMIMLYSAGSSRAYVNFGDSFWYIKRQLAWAALGGAAMYFFSIFDYHLYGGKLASLLYTGTLALLILLLIGFGETRNGATRWMFGFQPSELAKIAIIVLFSYKLSLPSEQKKLKSLQKGFLPYIGLLGIYIILIYMQPHLSCIILISLIAVILMFVAGTPMKHFGLLAVVAAIFLVVAILFSPYRLERVLTFADPFADKQGSGWQIVQSLYAIGSGGVFGVGLGKSRQKFLSLPEPHNDFIFSVLCEELGLIGAIVLIGLFIWLVIRGIKIAAKAPDLFGTLLVTGIIAIIALQALINIAVVTASIPVTGMPLPFFSYGGTALTITMAEIGVVLNVSRQSKLPL